jgi:hypothetical protein
MKQTIQINQMIVVVMTLVLLITWFYDLKTRFKLMPFKIKNKQFTVL